MRAVRRVDPSLRPLVAVSIDALHQAAEGGRQCTVGSTNDSYDNAGCNHQRIVQSRGHSTARMAQLKAGGAGDIELGAQVQPPALARVDWISIAGSSQSGV